MRNPQLFLLDAMLLGAAILAAFVIRFEGFGWLQSPGWDAILFMALIVGAGAAGGMIAKGLLDGPHLSIIPAASSTTTRAKRPPAAPRAGG